MRILNLLLSPIKGLLNFINTYFKSMIFVLIVVLIILSGSSTNRANLMEISLNGAITDEKDLLSQIELAKDPAIKGVLININSPGGDMSSSVAISDAIKSLNELKPVLAYASGTMTSGGYYAAIGADEIYANRGSFIGSIGVILQAPNIEKLADKIGISSQVVKAGEYKESGTYTRKWSQSERDELQRLVDKSYELFTTDVANARNLDINQASIWANARIFLASEALDLGLIDKISTYDEAKSRLKELSQVEIEMWYEAPVIERFMSGIAKQSSNLIINSLNQKNILWQW
ncbi:MULTISPECIES: signal peptide peptidase SppA [Campylobacter]|uniref:Signal peptide peptidase protease IV n=1 Tax=Campylobacter porcelli TaxID=1660073 RepID=A0A1X9SY17_9BACT|nr:MULTISPECIES: signal peptide peptidase SppA [unclassified Campylobacter]ARR01174.1 signal peptide peptidase protease IV [Campylobacter sp. RM6137]MCR8695995.1 signal peptide peptidase SppA [Campylobacter sp. RM19073]